MPNSVWSPKVTPNTPPLPGTFPSTRGSASATSSPNTRMRGSRAISSWSVRRIASPNATGSLSAAGGSAGRSMTGRGPTRWSEIRFGPDFLRSLGRQHAEPDELAFEEQDRIVFGFVLRLLGDAVLLLVVGERVRVRARHRCVDESRPLSGAHALDRLGAARSHLEV